MQIETYRKRAEHNVHESTLASRISGQRHLDEFIEGGEPTVEDVEEWVDYMIELHNEEEIKSSTIREYFKAVDYYFEMVKGEDEALEHIRKRIPTSDSSPGDFLTPDEWELLKENVPSYRDKAIIELMYKYSRRPTEVILLNMEDIDFEEDTITFCILKKKKANGQLLPMRKYGYNEETGEYRQSHRVFRAKFELETETRGILENYLKYRDDIWESAEIDGKEREVSPVFLARDGRISYDTVWRTVKVGAKRAGIDKNITPKGAGRHSRSTHLDWAGNSPDEIGRHMLLHDPDTNVIGRYIHERGEDEVREVMTTEDENNE